MENKMKEYRMLSQITIGSEVRIKKNFVGSTSGIKYSGEGIIPDSNEWGFVTSIYEEQARGNPLINAAAKKDTETTKMGLVTKKIAVVNFGQGVQQATIDLYKLCMGKIKKPVGLLHKICKECDKPFEDTSSLTVVHPACRAKYYRSLRRRQFEKKVHVRSRVKSARERYFINASPCAACGHLLLTKMREYFNLAIRQEEKYYICPTCLALIICGFMEPVTWKKVDILEQQLSAKVAAPKDEASAMEAVNI